MSATTQKKVIEIIAEQLMLDVEDVSVSATLEELQMDSLSLVEVVFSIEETFEISVPFNANDPNASAFDIASVGSMAEAIDKLVAEQKG